MTPYQYCRRAVENASGDDLERAEAAFRGWSDQKLDALYGTSGRSAREILDSYRKERADQQTALAWLDQVVKQGFIADNGKWVSW